MTAKRYRAELAALAVDTCDHRKCSGIEYPTTELLRCPHCDNLLCSGHSIRDLGCCQSAICLAKTANALRLQVIDLRERMAGAVSILQGRTK